MSLKNSVAFSCGKETIYLPFVTAYLDEFKQGLPVLRKLFLHGNHAHVVKFDAQKGDRGNDIMDVFESTGIATGGKTIEYTCEKCNKTFKFTYVQKSTDSQAVANLGVPELSKSYQCVHLHDANGEKHAYHFRILPSGKIQTGKYIEFAKKE
jgi:hypothetical protein